MVRRLCVPFLIALLTACGGGGGGGAPIILPTGSATTTPLPPQPATWAFTSLGPVNTSFLNIPESGKINAFAAASNNVLYIGGGAGTGLESFSDAGAYSSSDGGASWHQVYAGVVNALWLDPTQPAHVLVGDDDAGIFSSHDGGLTWQHVYPTTKVTQFAWFGSLLFASCSNGILVSVDRGNTWQVSSSNEAPATALGSAGNVLVAGMSDGSIYSYANAAWTKQGALPFTAQTGTQGSVPAVHQIAVDPLTTSTIYATNNDGPWNQMLFVSTNAGGTWNAVTYNGWPQAIAFGSMPHQLYIGNDGSLDELFSNGTPNPPIYSASYLKVVDIRNIWAQGNSCWIASDQGLDEVPDCVNLGKAGNDAVLSGPAGMTLARRLAVSSTGTIVSSFQDLQSFSTSTAGAAWTSLTYLYEDGFVDFRPGTSNVCYAYDETNGLSVSFDGGNTFAIPTTPIGNLAPLRLMTSPLAFDPSNPLHMYVASGPSPFASFAAQLGVFESSDGGKSFTPAAWPFNYPGAIVIDPHNGQHILVSDKEPGRSFVSSSFDGGKTWVNATALPAEPYWYAIAISPVSGNNVIVANADAGGNVFTMSSTDGGKTFGTSTVAARRARIVRGLASEREANVRLKRRSEARVSARQYYNYSPLRAVRFNQDATNGTPCAILASSQGAYESCTYGATWTRIDQALNVHSFWDVRWTGGYVYLASDGQGVLRSLAPSP